MKHFVSFSSKMDLSCIEIEIILFRAPRASIHSAMNNLLPLCLSMSSYSQQIQQQQLQSPLETHAHRIPADKRSAASKTAHHGLKAASGAIRETPRKTPKDNNIKSVAKSENRNISQITSKPRMSKIGQDLIVNQEHGGCGTGNHMPSLVLHGSCRRLKVWPRSLQALHVTSLSRGLHAEKCMLLQKMNLLPVCVFPSN